MIAVLLGNGLQNNPGGYIWNFDQLPYRGAPQFALSLSWADGRPFCRCIPFDGKCGKN